MEVLIVRKGQEVVSSVIEFCGRKGISSAAVTALGALSGVKIAFYDLKSKKYVWKTFDKNVELLNLTGNVAVLEGKPVLHAHVTLSGRDYRAFGGHLGSAVVSGTCEVFITPLKEKLVRQFDSETGLNLIRQR